MNNICVQPNFSVAAQALGATSTEAPYPWIILCDFDGTISLSDVIDTLLDQFGLPGHTALEDAWLAGKIGSRTCLAGQVELLDVSKAELDAAIGNIKIDPAFNDFVMLAQARGATIKIVSDGLDYAINQLLAAVGLNDLTVYANHLVQVSERRWRLEFPNSSNTCEKASGNCKCARVAVYHQRGQQVLFVGDGSSDYCASGKVDFVLAKHKLINFCQQTNIAHVAIHNFYQAIEFIDQHLPKLANSYFQSSTIGMAATTTR